MRPFPELQVFEETEARTAPLNMAIDEALLESVTVPTLRFYSWARPAISFGYFSAFADVAAEMPRRDLVRRWTGGGIVFHGSDLTYSMIIPKNDGDPPAWGRAVYAEIHQAIRDALAENANVALAVQDSPKISDACFANAVVADVVVDGRKIAGAAQRRTRAGLLHQGSIQYEALPQNFREAFARGLCSKFTRRSFSAELLARARELSAQKYETDEWLRRR